MWFELYKKIKFPLFLAKIDLLANDFSEVYCELFVDKMPFSRNISLLKGEYEDYRWGYGQNPPD